MLLRAALLACLSIMPVQVLAEPQLIAKLRGDGAALPAGSEVWLSTRFPISSARLNAGDRFELIVTRDVALGNLIVIPRGTLGHARVIQRTGKGAFGRSGKLEFEIVDVEIEGRLLPMTGRFRIEGTGNTDLTAVTLAAFGAVGGAFITGRSAALSNGVELPAFTAEPFAVAPGAR